MPLKKVVSFGFRHGMPTGGPGAVVIDIRAMFRNPHHNLRLRELTGLDVPVQVEIRKTRGFDAKYAFLKEQILVPGTEVVFIGCTGGRHRSVYIAERLAEDLSVPVEHRDL